MHDPDAGRGTVLILGDAAEAAERLGRWVAAAGEHPVTLVGAAVFMMRSGDDERVNLVVTDLDTDDPAARALVWRLARREIFPEVPQLHVLRDVALRDRLREIDPAVAAVALIAPVEASAFQARVRLAAELGRLRRERAQAATLDPLTGLGNESLVRRRLAEERARAMRHDVALSLVVLQLDAAPDDPELRRGAQAELGRIVRSRTRAEDACGHFGDGFAVVLTGNGPRGAAAFAHQVRRTAATRQLAAPDGPLSLRCSAGVSAFRPERRTTPVETLIEAASAALAEARLRGGNRVFIDEAVLRPERRLVVIADDDARWLDLAEDILTLDDLRVVRVESWATLVEAVRYRVPDLLVVGLDLVERDGGADWGARLFAGPGAAPPIVGIGRRADRLAPERHFVDHHLTRPFSFGVLRTLARDLLRRPALTRSL